MFSKGQKQGTFKFSVKANGSKKVAVAGDFTKWQPVEMRKQKDGSYSATVPLAAGSHEYKFILDGQWVVDPDNNAWSLNPYGTLNSVVQVS
jgi:1,4-alpha-glucan branching enzyme